LLLPAFSQVLRFDFAANYETVLSGVTSYLNFFDGNFNAVGSSLWIDRFRLAPTFCLSK
jgi:hypothetical protein